MMLQGKELFLRAMELEDIDLLYDIENDPANWPVSNTLVPFSRYTLEQYILSCGNQDIYTLKQLRLVICARQPQLPIGCVDLYDFDPTHLRAGVGILLTANYRKKGYATETLRLLEDYAFHTLHLKQLYCSIAPDNSDSLRLFTRAGFVPCGHFKSWRKNRNGEWEDELFFQHLSDA